MSRTETDVVAADVQIVCDRAETVPAGAADLVCNALRDILAERMPDRLVDLAPPGSEPAAPLRVEVHLSSLSRNGGGGWLGWQTDEASGRGEEIGMAVTDAEFGPDSARFFAQALLQATDIPVTGTPPDGGN